MLPLETQSNRRHFLTAAGLFGVAALTSYGKDEDPPLKPPDKQPPDVKIPELPQRKAGWAIVGLGKLAIEEIMPAFAVAKRSRPIALVSGHPDKAKRVAEAYGMNPKAIYNYDNYDKLAENPDVDVIYIVLPNSMHAEYTIRGLKAGKHVLCEKPMAVTVSESEEMVAVGKQKKKKLMIAYRLRYEPFNMTAIEICRKKELGQIKSIVTSNNQNVQAPNIRLSRELGGGPVGDIGIYCLNAARYLLGEEPTEVTAVAHQPKDDKRFREVPESVLFTLRFPGGAIANCDCSFGSVERRNFTIHGGDGALTMENAFAYQGQRLLLSRGKRDCEIALKPVNQFAAEMDHFSECVLDDRSPRTPGEEGLADMRVISAIDEAMRSGRLVSIRT